MTSKWLMGSLHYRRTESGLLQTDTIRDVLYWAENGKTTCKEHVLINVPYDAEYSTDQVTHLRGFYLSVMLPRVVDELIARRFKLNDKYLHISKKLNLLVNQD